MIRRAFAAVLFALSVPVAASAADVPFAGLTIGESVTVAAHDLGTPSSVASTNTGNVFTFPSVIAYIGDEGDVLAGDVTHGSVRVTIANVPHSFTIGTYTSAEADTEFAGIAEFTTNTLRTYRLSSTRELVLVFDKDTQKLVRVVYGQRGQIVRLGLLPGEDFVKAVPFLAPRVKTTAIAGTSGSDVTIVRIVLDGGGNITGLTVVVPSSDPAFDASLAKRMTDDRFYAAKLGGRNFPSVLYRAIRH